MATPKISMVWMRDLGAEDVEQHAVWLSYRSGTVDVLAAELLAGEVEREVARHRSR